MQSCGLDKKFEFSKMCGLKLKKLGDQNHGSGIKKGPKL